MVSNNFAEMLARRLEKISNVSKETGISRSTLTQLYYKRGKSISYDVLGKLCDYFQCQVGELLELKKSKHPTDQSVCLLESQEIGKPISMYRV